MVPHYYPYRLLLGLPDLMQHILLNDQSGIHIEILKKVYCFRNTMKVDFPNFLSTTFNIAGRTEIGLLLLIIDGSPFFNSRMTLATFNFSGKITVLKNWFCK